MVAGAEPVLVGEIGDPQGGELRVGLTTPCGTAGTDAALVQNVGDFGIDVVVEERVDQFDHLGIGLDLLGRRFGVLGGQGLGFAALEADMDPRRSFGWEFDEGNVSMM